MSDRLVCRGCHKALTDDEGCALCHSVKPHLMPVEATDEENVSLAQLAQETAGLLRKQLKQLKAAQAGTPAYDAELANQSRQHANALSKLLDSARKILEDGASAVQSMSFSERAELFISWFSELPPAYRRKLHERMGTQVAGARGEASADVH